MKTEHKPLFYILGMAVQLPVLVLSPVAGGWIDYFVWRIEQLAGEPGIGHPTPMFAVLLLVKALFVTPTVFVIMLIGLCRCVRRRKRERLGLAPAAAEWNFCPDCGAALHSFRRCDNCGRALKQGKGKKEETRPRRASQAVDKVSTA